MSLDAAAKTILLRKIPHGLFICGVAEGETVNGFTASWVTQGSFKPPLVVMGVRADSTSHGMIQRSRRFSLNVMAAHQKDLVAVFLQTPEGSWWTFVVRALPARGLGAAPAGRCPGRR